MNPTELWCPTETNGNTPSRMQFDITSYSQNIDGNYSDVNWRLRLRSTGSRSNFYAGALWIDGSQVYFSSTTILWSSWTDGYVLATGTKRIYHNSNGSKQFVVLMKQLFFLGYSTTRWGGDRYYSGDTSKTEVASTTITANDIPRYPLLALGAVTRELNKLTVGVSNTRTGTITNWEVRKVSNSSLVTSGTSSTISFSLTGLSPNTNYNSVYKIRAYANGGWGDYLTLLVGSTNALPTFSVTNFDVGGKPKITLTNLNNISSYSVKVKDGTTTIKTVSGITTNNYEVTLTSEELNTILNNHPNDIIIQLNYEVTVISNSVSYGLNNPTGNMTIPDSLYKPTFTLAMIGYADQNAVSLALTGSNQKIIKGISNILFTLQPMTANGGANPVSYQINSGSISNTGNHTGSAITILLNAVDAGNASITAIDSRGKTTTIPLTYSQFVDYAAPSIESINVRRSGGVTENLLFNVVGLFNNWSGLATSNSIQSIQYRYKEKGTSTWSSYISLTGISYDGNEYSITDILGTGDLFDISTEYDVEIKVTDRLSYDTIETPINSGEPYIWKDLLNKYLGIGKKPTEMLDVAGNLNVDGISSINDTIQSSGVFNRGNYNVPTKGAITQVVDNTQTQHSVMVGVREDNRARLYGIDLLDDYASPNLRIYAGSQYLQLGSDGLMVSGKSWLDKTYPIGSIYMSVVNTNPATLFGGTWEQISDKFLLGASSTYPVGTTGGSISHSHTIPAHNHILGDSGYAKLTLNENYIYQREVSGKSEMNYRKTLNSSYSGMTNTRNFGTALGGTTNNSNQLTSSTTNNIPPYLTVYMWKRTV